MCGRYGYIPTKADLGLFGVDSFGLGWDPSYNVPPSTLNPIVTMNSPKKFELAKWGLIPAWAKDPKIAFSTINARSEEVETKPVFRDSFKKHRCLVPMSFYYEFAVLKCDPKTKIPYVFKVKDAQNFAVAGLYSDWKDAEGREVRTYSILTTEANSTGAAVHSRMPCIVKPEDYDEWLDNSHYEIVVLKNILQPIPGNDLETWQVSRDVNSPKNDRESLIEKVKPVPVDPSRPAWETKNST